MTKFKNPFRACIPYRLNTSQRITERLVENVEEYTVGPLEQSLRDNACPEPMGHQWRSSGLAPVADGLHAIVFGDCVQMCVEFAERVLPSKVRDRQVDTMYAKFVAEHGRKPSKKEYRELRDQAEHELLPRAFVKRTQVMAVFSTDTVFIWTSSQKKADEVAGVLSYVINSVLGTTLGIAKVTMKNRMASVLSALARGDDDEMQPGSSAVLKGTDEHKRTIRVKDRSVLADEIQRLLANGYEVTALSLSIDDTDFTVNDNLAFSKLGFAGGKDDSEDALRSIGWLSVRSIREVLDKLLAQCGEMEIEWGAEKAGDDGDGDDI